MLKGASLSTKLFTGFGGVLCIVAALGTFAFTRLTRIDGNAQIIIKDCLPGTLLAGEIQATVLESMIHVNQYLLSDDKAEMEKIGAAIEEGKEKIGAYLKKYEATITEPKDRQLFDAIGPVRDRFIQVRNTIVAQCRAGKSKEALEAYKSQLQPAFQTYFAAAGDVVKFNKENGEVKGAEIVGAVSAAKSGILVGILVALAIGAALGIFLSRSISAALNGVISSLTSGSEQVSSASNQVSSSSQSMAEGASQQASSLEETSASLEEMSSMTRQNSDNARQANGMASETRDAVEKSREAMTRMGDAIARIKGSSDQTAKIIKTIDEIAFQTNLLALNAAVEAARAGDAGKGFAVVAEEVRNLAQRSAEAAKSTATLIEESQQNANNGVAVSSEVAGILTGIVESVRKLTQLIGEVSAASEEQSKGIEQIGTAVTEMDKLTQSNAANAEESASASEELAAQAKELGDMVQILVGIVKGAGSQGTYSAPSAGSHGLPRAARPIAASKERARASTRPAGRPQGDWSAASAGKAHGNGNGHSNGHARKAALTGSLTLSPEQVIPMDDSDLKDF